MSDLDLQQDARLTIKQRLRAAELLRWASENDNRLVEQLLAPLATPPDFVVMDTDPAPDILVKLCPKCLGVTPQDNSACTFCDGLGYIPDQ